MTWTLEYLGGERSLADWGLAEEVSRRMVNMGPDRLTVSAPGPMDAAPKFAYGREVIVRRGRAPGESGYAGGSIYFRGKVARVFRSGSGRGEAIGYEFCGPWWDFERLVFQQLWKICTGFEDGEYTYGTWRTSELFLCRTNEGAAQDTGAQIREAVGWAVTCGVAVQLGTIDAAVNIPWYHVRDVTVAEVIRQMLRWTPDVVVWFDYTTTPPTMHARRLANLPVVEVGVADAVLEELELTPRQDLVLPAVCLRFKQIGSIDGRPFTVFTDQFYPEEATGRELGAAVHTIDLAGYQKTNVYGELECAECAAQAETNAARLAWWQGKEPLLNSPRVDTRLTPEKITVSAAVIRDANGDEVDLEDYPYELLDGQVAEWMEDGGQPVVVVSATVTARVTYDLYRTDEGWLETNAEKFLLERGRTKELSCRIRLTNGRGGRYSAVATEAQGELPPAGLAQAIYEAHAVLQYEGRIACVAEEVLPALRMGIKLRVQTGEATYDNLLVQGVEEAVGSGQTQVMVGPASHLGLADLVELLRVNRSRLVYENPRVYSGGQAGGGESVTLGRNLPRENTTAGLGDRRQAALTAADGENTALLSLDAEKQKLELGLVDADGDRVEDSAGITLAVGDLEHATAAEGKEVDAKLRRVHYTDSRDGALSRCYGLFTASEADEDDEHDDEVEDLYFGGGGGAVRMRVKEVHGDYLTCRTWDGENEGEADVQVAKPPQLRHSLSGQTVAGVEVSYSDYDIDGGVCTRTASADGYDDQEEMVIPVYQLGARADAEIWAYQPTGGTGVVNAPDWLDVNCDARAWCYNVPEPV